MTGNFRQEHVAIAWIWSNGDWLPVNSDSWEWNSTKREWEPHNDEEFTWNPSTKFWEPTPR